MGPKKRYPIIGFIGLILLICGFGGYAMSNSPFIGIFGVIGIFVLVYALFTGHIKLFG